MFVKASSYNVYVGRGLRKALLTLVVMLSTHNFARCSVLKLYITSEWTSWMWEFRVKIHRIQQPRFLLSLTRNDFTKRVGQVGRLSHITFDIYDISSKRRLAHQISNNPFIGTHNILQ